MTPNIVIVMCDQFRADLRKSRGYALDTMPFLDEWSRRGVDFLGGYTPNPVCLPARVSMFTGRYPSAHRVHTNHNKDDVLYTEDILDVLKKQGYVTAACGKNHSHRNPGDFDYHALNDHMAKYYDGMTKEGYEEFSDFLNDTKHMEAHSPAPGGIEAQHPYRNVTSAFDFIDNHAGDKPFFLWLSFAEPHSPYHVPEPYFDMFPPESLPAITTSADDLPAKGDRFVWLRKQWEEVMGEDIDRRIVRTRSNYHGMLRLIDDQFKRFIEGLERRGISDNTLVMFVADHGDFVGEYGLIRKGADLAELLVNIPFICAGAGVTAPRADDTSMINLIDILPTLCELTGADTPFGCQGRSLVPLLQGNPISDEEFSTAYSESGFSGLYWDDNDTLDTETEGAKNPYVTFDCLNSWTQSGQVRMARRGEYKVQIDMMERGYLYNLKEDPLEINNLWNHPAHTHIKAEMLAALAGCVLRASDPLPPPHWRYRVKTHPHGYWFDGSYTSGDTGIRPK